MDSISLIGRQ